MILRHFAILLSTAALLSAAAPFAADEMEAAFLSARAGVDMEMVSTCFGDHLGGLVASGKIDVAGFVSNTYPLTQADAAFKEYESNPGRILRLVIDSTQT